MTRKGNVSSGVLLILPTSFTVWYSQIACVAVGDGEKRKKGRGGAGLGRTKNIVVKFDKHFLFIFFFISSFCRKE